MFQDRAPWDKKKIARVSRSFNLPTPGRIYVFLLSWPLSSLGVSFCLFLFGCWGKKTRKKKLYAIFFQHAPCLSCRWRHHTRPHRSTSCKNRSHCSTRECLSRHASFCADGSIPLEDWHWVMQSDPENGSSWCVSATRGIPNKTFICHWHPGWGVDPKHSSTRKPFW